MANYSGPASPPVTNTSMQAYGTATAPGAGATLATLSTPGAGYYQVDWRISLSGTITAAEVNNVLIGIVGGSTLVHSVVNGSGHDDYGTFFVALTAAQSLAFTTVAAGGVAAVYSVRLNATKIASVYG